MNGKIDDPLKSCYQEIATTTVASPTVSIDKTSTTAKTTPM